MKDYQNHSSYAISIRIIVIVIHTRVRYIARSCVLMYILSAHDVVTSTLVIWKFKIQTVDFSTISFYGHYVIKANSCIEEASHNTLNALIYSLHCYCKHKCLHSACLFTQPHCIHDQDTREKRRISFYVAYKKISNEICCVTVYSTVACTENDGHSEHASYSAVQVGILHLCYSIIFHTLIMTVNKLIWWGLIK